MITFRPTRLSESIGLGKGIAAATGHSLHLVGDVWDQGSGDANRPFCEGSLRIESKVDPNGRSGVFQVQSDAGKPSFSAALLVDAHEFGSIRELLLRADAEVSLEIENANQLYMSEIIKSAAQTIEISSVSVSGRHHTNFLQKGRSR